MLLKGKPNEGSGPMRTRDRNRGEQRFRPYKNHSESDQTIRGTKELPKRNSDSHAAIKKHYRGSETTSAYEQPTSGDTNSFSTRDLMESLTRSLGKHHIIKVEEPPEQKQEKQLDKPSPRSPDTKWTIRKLLSPAMLSRAALLGIGILAATAPGRDSSQRSAGNMTDRFGLTDSPFVPTLENPYDTVGLSGMKPSLLADEVSSLLGQKKFVDGVGSLLQNEKVAEGVSALLEDQEGLVKKITPFFEQKEVMDGVGSLLQNKEVAKGVSSFLEKRGEIPRYRAEESQNSEFGDHDGGRDHDRDHNRGRDHDRSRDPDRSSSVKGHPQSTKTGIGTSQSVETPSLTGLSRTTETGQPRSTETEQPRPTETEQPRPTETGQPQLPSLDVAVIALTAAMGVAICWRAYQECKRRRREAVISQGAEGDADSFVPADHVPRYHDFNNKLQEVQRLAAHVMYYTNPRVRDMIRPNWEEDSPNNLPPLSRRLSTIGRIYDGRRTRAGNLGNLGEYSAFIEQHLSEVARVLNLSSKEVEIKQAFRNSSVYRWNTQQGTLSRLGSFRTEYSEAIRYIRDIEQEQATVDQDVNKAIEALKRTEEAYDEFFKDIDKHLTNNERDYINQIKSQRRDFCLPEYKPSVDVQQRVDQDIPLSGVREAMVTLHTSFRKVLARNTESQEVAAMIRDRKIVLRDSLGQTEASRKTINLAIFNRTTL